MSPPALSLVVLSWNEEANIGSCLQAVAKQDVPPGALELIVVDAASRDRTADIVRRAIPGLVAQGTPTRLHVAGRRLAIGEARNLGVRLAAAPCIGFVSADARLAPDWVRLALGALQDADLVVGRQVHDPPRWTVGAAVRGLRYRFPASAVADPVRYASNVAAAYRRHVLDSFPFEAGADAAEDLLLARRAAASGARVAYHPGLVVRHADVPDARTEMRKMVREGRALGRHAAELGVQWLVLAWAAALLGAAVLAGLRPAFGLPALALVTWAPALRRAALRRPRPTSPAAAWHVALGVAATPAFDLVFLACYLRGLTRPRSHRRPSPPSHDVTP